MIGNIKYNSLLVGTLLVFWFNVSWRLPPNHYTKTKAEAEELIKKWNKREIEQNSKWRVIKTL